MTRLSWKVVLPRTAYNAFRETCYQVYPKEHLSALVGTVEDAVVVVTDFLGLHHTHPNKNTIDYGEDDLASVKMRAVRQGKRFVGTIHSHPGAGHRERENLDWHWRLIERITRVKETPANEKARVGDHRNVGMYTGVLGTIARDGDTLALDTLSVV